MKKRRILIALALIFTLLTGCSGGLSLLPELSGHEPDADIAETSAPEDAPEDAQTQPSTEALTEPPTEATTEPQPERFLITLTGDCTLGADPSLYYAGWGFIKIVGDDLDIPFRNVRQYFEADDFTMINFEGVLVDGGRPLNKMFAFSGPTSYIGIMSGSSVEAVTLANNHTLDYGTKGYDSTLRTFDASDVRYVEKNSTLLYTTASGLTIGVYAEDYSCFDMDLLKSSVAQLREAGAELVIYAVHWGAEGSYYPQPHQEDWAREAVDAGVDIVYGTHPHVLQNIEHYGGGVIFYSLGNFSFGGHMYPRDRDSALVQQEVIRWPDGTVELGELTVVPVCISSISERNDYQPTPYPEDSEGYARVLEKLQGLWKGKDLKVDYDF